jgi:inorganic pyrophosphatase
MPTPFESVPSRDATSGLVNVIIDTPRGSRNKFKFDEQLGCFRLSRILPLRHSFPYDFGSIPGTRAEDGDALDVLVVMDEPTFPGCLMTARLVGVLVARQTEKGETIQNDRLVAVPQTPVNKASIHSLEQLGTERIEQIEHFFVAYNQAQGRHFEPVDRKGPEKADALLDAAIAKFQKARAR